MVNKRCKLCKLNHIDKEIFPNDKERKLCSSNCGITLIALVVTIIILLILAGITITTVLGDNGVIELAKQAKKETIVTTVKEAIDIAKLSKSLEKEDGLITENELKEILENYGEIIYDESGEIIEGIIENQEGYEVLLPDIMDGVINQNIYVKLYADGTLAFSNNKNTVIEGTQVSKDYGNIKGQEYTHYWEDGKIIIADTPWYNDTNAIVKAMFLDEIKPSSTEAWFANCNKITDFENMENLNTTYVKSMSHMFACCTNLTKVDINILNTRRVTSTSHMFALCTNLQEIKLENIDTSNITDMSYMFDECTNLTNLDVSNFNTSKVTTMRAIFEGCEKLTSIDVSNFNTRNVTDMYAMFGRCQELTQINVSNFVTSNVTDMMSMFFGCTKLTTLNLLNFDTSNVNNMYHMFYNCQGLTTLDLSSFNTSNVTTMYGMFYHCDNLTTLDLSSFDTNKVTTMENMFRSTQKLTLIYVSPQWVINPSTNTTNMFLNCGTSSVTPKT